MIAASGLTRRFGSRTVVDRVSFEVARSEIVALLGPNGAGKTTTMRMLVGLIGPSDGTVAIDGMRMTRATGSLLRSRIGFLSESPGLWDRLTVRENLEVYARLYALDSPARQVDRVIEMFGLRNDATARAAELSKGTKQKVALGRALLHDPPVLILDEPTSGLDPEITRAVRTLLDSRRSAGCAILISTHNLDEAERLADRVAVLHGKLLALDEPRGLRRKLTTGRTIVRVVGSASTHLETARKFDRQAAADGPVMTITLADPDHDTPRLVSAMVANGAALLEVRPDIPALEDVYLHLLGTSS